MRIRALVVACVVAIAGCHSGPTTPTPASCTYTVSSTAVTIGAAGGPGSVTVSSGSSCAWTGRSDVTWITATSGTSGTGPGTFSFIVAAAADSSVRTGTLTVAGQSVLVSQQGQACSYSVSPSGMSFGASGGSTSFTVSTASVCSWAVTASASWLSVTSGASGTGSSAVSYSVAANPDAAPRTGSLTVAGQTHAVTQAGLSSCTVTLGQDDETFAAAGGTGTFDVTSASSCDWTIGSDAAWISVTDPPGGFGTGSRRVSYSVATNTGDAARTGTMRVGGQTFVVTQAGARVCTYSVAPVEFPACPSGLHDVTVTVSTDTGCGWTASPAVPWLTISSGASGYGTGRITFDVGSNNYDPPRQGNVEVRWPTPTAGQNVSVHQDGCSYVTSTGSMSIPAAGGDYSFQVFADTTNPACGGPLQDYCVWSAASSASWVTVRNPGSSRGYDWVFLRVAANATGSARSATITVRDKTVLIGQAGI